MHRAKSGDGEPAGESEEVVEWSRTVVVALADGRLHGLLVDWLGDWLGSSLSSSTRAAGVGVALLETRRIICFGSLEHTQHALSKAKQPVPARASGWIRFGLRGFGMPFDGLAVLLQSMVSIQSRKCVTNRSPASWN